MPRPCAGLLFCPAPGFLGATAADAPGDPASPALPPKRPRTAFNYFSDAVRPGVREQHPLVDPKARARLGRAGLVGAGLPAQRLRCVCPLSTVDVVAAGAPGEAP